MAKVNITLKGFEKMLKNISEAGKDADKAADRAISESIKVYDTELHTAATSHGVPASLTSEIKSAQYKEGNFYGGRVGWEVGSYDRKNPSAGMKAIFLNYGTVRRQTKRGYNRGAIDKSDSSQRGFIEAAKRAARPKIKKAQKKIIDEVMEDLSK